MYKKRKTFIFGTTLAAVLVMTIAVYFFTQIRLGVQKDNLSNLSAFGTQLDAHFDEMNGKYFSVLKSCLEASRSGAYHSREEILDFFRDKQDIWQYRTAGIMDKNGGYVTIEGETGTLEDLSFQEKKAGYIDNDSMSIVNLGVGDELLYYASLEESIWDAAEIGGIFVTPAFDELEYLLALNVYTEEGYATIIDKEGNILLKPHYDYSMMITDNYLDSLEHSDLYGREPDEQLRNDMAASASGSLIFSWMGKRNYLVYMPVGRSSWYLLVTVPANVLETTTRSFRNFMIAALLVTVVLLLCFCTIYFTGRQHIIDKKNREILAKEQISKKKLADALEEARQANRAKSIFLSNMSHDIQKKLLETEGISYQVFMLQFFHIYRKIKMTADDLRLNDALQCMKQLSQVKVLTVQRQLAAFDPGHIQHIVDQGEQVCGGRGDLIQAVLYFFLPVYM